MKTIYYIWIIISILTLSSCKKVFDYSPYVIDFDEDNTNVNSKNIEKILSQKNNDNVITIVFTGDTHREFDEFVKKTNSLNNSEHIDFVVHVGDIADFGLQKQYLWGNSALLNLEVPYVVVLGNNDLVGNGGDAYHEMFGEYNFSFIYDSIKFISLKTNGLEFQYNGKVPDINWLDSQLRPTENFKKAIVLIHVPPMNTEFDPAFKEAFVSTVSKYSLYYSWSYTSSFSLYPIFRQYNLFRYF